MAEGRGTHASRSFVRQKVAALSADANRGMFLLCCKIRTVEPTLNSERCLCLRMLHSYVIS